jgi:hypothetical protein
LLATTFADVFADFAMMLKILILPKPVGGGLSMLTLQS